MGQGKILKYYSSNGKRDLGGPLLNKIRKIGGLRLLMVTPDEKYASLRIYNYRTKNRTTACPTPP